jgi:hypothetical protein
MAQREPLMSVEDLASYLRRPKSWVYDNHGPRGAKIPSVKVGQAVMFRPHAVDRWLDSSVE